MLKFATIAATGLILAGCTAQSKPATPTTSTTGTNTGVVKADQKVGYTTLTGTISKAGEQFLFTVPGKAAKGIDSYKLKLGDYVGKSVTVTGQYSGDTLFVNKIE